MGYLAFVVEHDLQNTFVSDAAHERFFAHHVTLKFPATEADLAEVEARYGNPTQFIVSGYGDDGSVDCYTGDFGNGVDTQVGSDTKLHMTLSCSKESQPVMAKHAAVLATSIPRFKITGKVVLVP